MRQKEIEVWINEDAAEVGVMHMWNSRFSDACTLKARLIIDLPEKKVTISESDLRDCFDSFRHLDNDHDRRLVYSFYEFTREKLFGTDHANNGGVNES